MFLSFLLLLLLPLVHCSHIITEQDKSALQAISPKCRHPKDKGTQCSSSNNNNATIQFYFDPDTFNCLAFKYQGCSGNENRFESGVKCRMECLPQDFGGCSGQRVPAKNSKGDTISCPTQPNYPTNEKCPSDYECHGSYPAVMGICCHRETEEYFRSSQSPKCAGGKEPAKVEEIHTVLLGKSCGDEFCPVGYKCTQQELFAHCCPGE